MIAPSVLSCRVAVPTVAFANSVNAQATTSYGNRHAEYLIQDAASRASFVGPRRTLAENADRQH